MRSWKAGIRIVGAMIALGLALSSGASAPECEIDSDSGLTNPCGYETGFVMAWHEGLKRCVFAEGNCGSWQDQLVDLEGGASHE